MQAVGYWVERFVMVLIAFQVYAARLQWSADVSRIVDLHRCSSGDTLLLSAKDGFMLL